MSESERELDRTERVRRRAYEMWEEAGRPAGRSEEYWERAWAEVADEDDEP